jgi:hypothetical protein
LAYFQDTIDLYDTAVRICNQAVKLLSDEVVSPEKMIETRKVTVDGRDVVISASGDCRVRVERIPDAFPLASASETTSTISLHKVRFCSSRFLHAVR